MKDRREKEEGMADSSKEDMTTREEGILGTKIIEVVTKDTPTDLLKDIKAMDSIIDNRTTISTITGMEEAGTRISSIETSIMEGMEDMEVINTGEEIMVAMEDMEVITIMEANMEITERINMIREVEITSILRINNTLAHQEAVHNLIINPSPQILLLKLTNPLITTPLKPLLEPLAQL